MKHFLSIDRFPPSDRKKHFFNSTDFLRAIANNLFSFDRFPPSDRYKFSEADATDNIVFEDPDKSNGIPLIKVTTERSEIQWGSEIRTCPDFSWSIVDRVPNGPVLEWLAIQNLTFKMSGFRMPGFRIPTLVGCQGVLQLVGLVRVSHW